MTGLPVAIVCAGCGYQPRDDDPYPFRCANARPGDDVDHVLGVELDPTRLQFPRGDEPNPFVRFRTLFHSYHLARAHGLTDADYVALVERLDRAVAGVDGRGFVVTPFARNDALSAHVGLRDPGGVWVKDETANVSGSHKGRHLMGLLIHLEVVERLGLARRDGGTPDLAIASCGNAALAAAVVARTGERRLRVFIPTTADPVVVDRLRALGAELTVSPRQDGVAGDPTYHDLRRAVEAGALPFTCQGPDNGLTIEGGKTLGYEILAQLREAGGGLERLVVQVGGGALASAVIQALEDGLRLGALERMPRIYTVQTEGAWPLRRAFVRVQERMRGGEAAADALRHAAEHRSAYMWPWEEEPRSIASGILDDETYDWVAVVRGMVETGGSPLVVSEETLAAANRLAREATGIDVDPTGSAGLAGLMHLHHDGWRPAPEAPGESWRPAPEAPGESLDAEERVAVLFTGVRR